MLVHGFASSFERNWREPGWVDLLGDAGREVIGLDLLGHGAASKPHDPGAYADLESDVAAALPKVSDDGKTVSNRDLAYAVAAGAKYVKAEGAPSAPKKDETPAEEKEEAKSE